jgi:predicted HTH domain antitoxin
VDASPKKTANHDRKSDAATGRDVASATLRDIASATLRERIILPPVTTEVKFTLSMLPEIPYIHREEAENKAKEAYVMTLLRHHDISAGRAAELLSINRWELSDLMDVYDICPFAELTAEELQREVAETMMMLEANQK